MTNKAAMLVEGAKEWAANYGDFSNGSEGAVLTAPLRVRAAWGANDADAFADMFIDNGSALFGDRQLTSREEIRQYMAEAFAAGWKGTRLIEEPREIKLLTETSAVVIADGGVARDSEENFTFRTVWVVVKRDGDWRIASYQTSPVKN
ncbi:SgcJ/EcaC family oxidoreductase [Catellatospora sp. KI3]|uniref:SgcJ/EcaC family oxidoreductase n=1 Tax=Catellatospora sp. KI3 TaxID=3041620 RepID=UPI00248326C0|nr:SgcJ/EcaC family oxidoreductase [Catellatospora sp. KI3]MDI1461459.1 SgcJ/EcaC family oxidoreductase [Catellatospora sp. KI3]